MPRAPPVTRATRLRNFSAALMCPGLYR
jgi:hypothetical protein